MLANILENMWVDPEVLEALNEEQKRILFLKMRGEQVRRWRVREEKEKREGQNNVRPKKASTKRVTWLIGRDGDVSVSINGEMDELKSSKLLQNLNNRVHIDSRNGIQTMDLLPDREARQINFKDDVTHVNEDSVSPNKQKSEEDMDVCSTGDNLKESSEDRDTDSGNSADSSSDCNLVYRPNFCSHGNQPLKAQLSGTERASLQDRATICHKDTSERHSHVTQLRKAFADEPHQKSPFSNKPPIPAKPAHLQKRSQP